MGQGVEVGHNLRYYAGFRSPPEEIHQGQALLPYLRNESLVVIPRNGEPALLTTRADEHLLRRQTWIQDVRSGRETYLGDERLTGLAQMTRDVLRERGISRGKVGIAGVGITLGLYQALVRANPRLEFVECTEEVDRLRMIKSENELKIMRKAAEIADVGVEAFYETAKEGVLEYEVHQAVERAMFDAGGDNPWSVIMSGPRAYISYVSPDYTQRILKSGDMMHADIGSEYGGYHSDIQPVAIIGTPLQEQISLLATDIKVMRAMIAATKPGASDKDIVQAAVSSARGEPFGDRLRMYLFGHGYGVGVDPPNLTARTLQKARHEKIILKPNMLLCYEPALNVPGVGGAALEDELIVTDSGCEVITKCLAHAERLLSELKSHR